MQSISFNKRKFGYSKTNINKSSNKNFINIDYNIISVGVKITNLHLNSADK